jgi:predicted O-linked N-acetylglucosamine transferase (SPINDLY family)
MGVPVLSLAGRMCASRQGARVLQAGGLAELVAESPEGYLRLAAELAADRGRLEALRRGLRERLRRSPLLDGRRLTRDLEAAYLGMWQKWADQAGTTEGRT